MGDVHKAVTFAVAWLLAAGVAGAVAWQGVGIVTRQVTDDRPAPLSAAELRARTDVEPASGSTTSTTSATSTSMPPPLASPTTIAPGATASPPPPQPAPTTTAPGPTESPTTTSPSTAETRTYNLVGGSVSLRFTPEGVTVLWANPNAGFEVETEPEHTNGVQVSFESETHRSRVAGWWEDGPQDRVREEDDR